MRLSSWVSGLVAMHVSSASLGVSAPIPVTIEAKGEGYVLMRQGQPYVIRGSGGDGSLEALAAAGANSLRTWGADDLGARLDAAHALGLTVTVGIWLGHERHGFDYTDDDQVFAQLEAARKAVLAYRNHPALLMWGVGNEMEGFEAGDNAAIWSAVNNVAALVKALDPNHPTMTVLAEIGGKRVANVHRLAPAIDIVGINAYGGVRSLPERYRVAGGTKPFVVTEFGPPGTWEIAKTAWGAPVEPTSLAKARSYEAGYKAIDAAPRALGSYAFVWGNKREGTATWFGLLLPDGTPLNQADRMQRMWSGVYPKNRSPEISALVPIGSAAREPGDTVVVKATVSDPERDRIKMTWVLEPEAREHVTFGDTQAEPEALEGAVEVTGPTTVKVRLPKRPGAYRLYAYARDGRGASTANLPLFARGPIPKGNAVTSLPVDVLATDPARWVPSGYMGSSEAIAMEPARSDGRDGLEVRYQRAGDWGGVVWQHPANDWGDRPGGFDLTGAKRLTFWARGAKGGERVKFGYGLLGPDKLHPDTSGKEMEKTLSKMWKRYTLDLEGKDLSRIKSGFYWVLGGTGAPITFYLSDIRYESDR